ncbi:MerR family transcriptional regulator [Dictyobacter aurantiacus]|uniref:HTH merR-type domain-containing protein n=1 Tax=Dictyobacter aurantiacus TaxID=1936993 RepID=A0A401ZE34_9CHLR|nr:MerR family transcriptional regulator [Dictyobacter aurantiacus]GCE05122.1 hypothetical protein KDAU_24510 [Dictyobacter aurantiacus]
MRKLLRIGEVAQLLGVSTKTIRHYHKINLLQEPERTEAGYRLYSSQDLMRLRQIRQLQSYGLPLKTIKTILGDPTREHPLHELLRALDQELVAQISALEQRRQRIRALLVEEDTHLDVTQPATAASVAWVKEVLGERVTQISPRAVQLEAKIWSAIQNFQWPEAFSERVQEAVSQLATHDDLLEYLLPFYDRVVALEALAEDAPEVQQLAEECLRNTAFRELIQHLTLLSQQSPMLEAPFADVFGDMVNATLAPAQRHFFALLAPSINQETIGAM